jgi:uncharacterized DUF497 family protein
VRRGSVVFGPLLQMPSAGNYSYSPAGVWLRSVAMPAGSTMRSIPYRFEWDPEKAARNERDHGVTFDEATEAFGDPLSLNMPDPDHSLAENRFVVPGLSRQSRLLVVPYAERGLRTRLISARLASRLERHRYEEDSA